MVSRGRIFIAPAYLFACLILGGSAQGIWQNMFLQLLGLAIIAWAAMDRGEEPVPKAAKQLIVLAIAAVAVVAIQLVPLPPDFWVHLGPRQRLAQDFGMLGMRVPAEPLSLTPAATLDTLLKVIPPLALFCAMVRLKAYRPQWLAVALILGTVAGIALGAIQVATSGAGASPWYLYDETSVGRGVGFFANRDHMATLLIVTIPFIGAIVAVGKRTTMQRYSAIIAALSGVMILLLIGLALNGSLAGYGLVLPVVAASALIIIPRGSRLRLWIVAAAVLLLVGSTALVETAPIDAGTLGGHASSAVDSRSELLSTTLRATRDFMPWGSGFGSFQSVYPLYESPRQVTDVYVVHAHNEYVEIALELGLPGILLLLLFFAWWIAAVHRVWRSPEARPFVRAASIASAAILVHSIVDFPLRTAAIAGCFAIALALLADSRGTPAKEEKQLRRRRHRSI
jgi:O-antigen ligase